MSIGISILIFFLSIIALVFEFFLYMMMGIGTAFSGETTPSFDNVYFFIGLMVLTGATGIIAPISAIIGSIAKKKHLANRIFLFSLLITGLGYFIVLSLIPSIDNINIENIEENNTDSSQDSPKEKPANTSVKLPSPPKISEKQIKNKYINNFLQLKEVKVSTGYGEYDTPGISTPKKSVFGTIKNIGDKSLSYLKIRVYFLDAEGTRIAEKDYTIVNTNSMFDKTSFLKPNYVQDFGFTIQNDAPSSWSEKVEVEISKIDFE